MRMPKLIQEWMKQVFLNCSQMALFSFLNEQLPSSQFSHFEVCSSSNHVSVRLCWQSYHKYSKVSDFFSGHFSVLFVNLCL